MNPSFSGPPPTLREFRLFPRVCPENWFANRGGSAKNEPKRTRGRRGLEKNERSFRPPRRPNICEHFRNFFGLRTRRKGGGVDEKRIVGEGVRKTPWFATIFWIDPVHSGAVLPLESPRAPPPPKGNVVERNDLLYSQMLASQPNLSRHMEEQASQCERFLVP